MKWTKIEDYVTAADVVDRDCVYPDCMIEVDGCRACEHACPFERMKRALNKPWPDTAPF